MPRQISNGLHCIRHANGEMLIVLHCFFNMEPILTHEPRVVRCGLISVFFFEEFIIIITSRRTDQTPLHIAASVSKCRPMAMALLFHPDIDPDLLNNSNEKAAEIARRSGRALPIFQMGHSAFRNQIGLID